MENSSFEKALQLVDKPSADIISDIGVGLQEAREELGFTLEEVAEELRFTVAEIKNIEAGRNPDLLLTVILSFYYTKYFEFGYELMQFYFERCFNREMLPKK